MELVRHELVRILAVVVPAFNEAQRLTGNLLTLLSSSAEPIAPEAELIVVDDGSTDGTAAGRRKNFSCASRCGDARAALRRRTAAKVMPFAPACSPPRRRSRFSPTPIFRLRSRNCRRSSNRSRRETYDIVLGSRALDRSLIGHRQPWRREQGGKGLQRDRAPGDRPSVFRHSVRLQSIPNGSRPADHRAGADRRLRLRRRTCSSSRSAPACACSRCRCAGITTRAARCTLCATACACSAESRELAHAGRAMEHSVSRGCGGVALGAGRRGHPKTWKSFKTIR
mgnify:CR=1 FL=1